MSDNENTSCPNHWKRQNLGDVLKVVRGVSFPSEDKKLSFAEDHIVCLRTANVQEDVDWQDLWYIPEEHVSREEQYVKSDDILISTANSYELVGKVSLVRNLPERATLGAFISLIRVPEGFSSKFVFYQLRSTAIRNEMRQRASTTTNISNISTSNLKEIPLYFPPLPEQRRIVAKIEELFSNLDAGMGELSVAEQQLERYRLSVLQAAVEGRLTADWRRTHDPEPADQLLERILEERRAQWEERYRWKRYDSKGKKPPSGWKDRYKEPESPDTEDLSAPPEGWIWITLEQLGEWTGGNTPRRSNDAYWEAGTIPWVSPKDMKSEEITDTKDYMTELALQEANASQVGDGSLLFVTRSGILRHTLPVAIARVQVTINQDLKALQLTPSVNSDYLLRWAQGKNQAIRLDCMKHGTTVQSIKSKALYRYPVPLPPLAEQKQIVAEVERLLSVADDASATTKQEQTRAERLRQSILKQAFSGKLVPHEAQHSAPETPPTPAARVGEQMEMGL